ncbi:hypothetical protein K3495_g16447, partial [Podosphaera aphanis]
MTNLNQQDNSDILQRTTDDRAACIEDQNRISILPHTNDLDVQKPLEIQSQKEKRKKRRTHIKTSSFLVAPQIDQVLDSPNYILSSVSPSSSNKSNKALELEKEKSIIKDEIVCSPENEEQNDDNGKKDRSFHVTASCQLSSLDYDTEDLGAGISRSENRIEKPLPRYFTRSTKRKRLSTDDETERQIKIIKAMLASEIIYSSDNDEIENAYNAVGFDFAFPSEVISGIKIPRTYKEAVNDPQFSKQWKKAMAEELTSLISNETWKPVIPPQG